MKYFAIALLLCYLMSGCAATNYEVKEASAEVQTALETLRDAQREFRNMYLAELAHTLGLIEKTIISKRITAKVNELSSAQTEGNFIELAEMLKNEREAAKKWVGKLRNENLQAEDTAAAVLARIQDRDVKSLRQLAELNRAQNNAVMADLFAGEAERIQAEDWSEDDDALALINLRLTMIDVRSGLKDLDNYVKFLQVIHGDVHEWVSTDVVVQGNEVANVIEKYQAVLKAGATEGEGQ